MSTNEDTTNAFVAFFSKIAGDKDYWIFWVAFSVGAWTGFYITQVLAFLLLGVVTATVIILTVITKICRYYKCKKQSKQLAIKQIEEKRLQQEQSIQAKKTHDENRAKLIWRYVAHIDDTDRIIATQILNYPIHDGDKFTRFIKKPTSSYDDDGQKCYAILNVVDKFRYTLNNGVSKLYLMEKQQIREGYYCMIDPYLYKILEHYKDTNKWEKV